MIRSPYSLLSRTGSCLFLTALVGAGCDESTPMTDPIPTTDGIVLTQVAQGLLDPVYLAAPLGDPRLFVVEQRGTIRIVDGGQVLPTAFLDITDKTHASGEQGLLSVAFHPDWFANGQFFVNYTDLSGATVVERYSRADLTGLADPGSAFQILRVPQPFSNHNGGQLQFGADGMLYVGMGDGGDGGDPLGHGQNLSTLHGALLRLDVDGGSPYAIPGDNPFAGGGGGLPEIWGYGLRNPWRFSFDRAGQDLYIADVGQNRLEEINMASSSASGLNYGWNTMEGTECFGGGACDPAGLTLPVHEYGHGEGCSVTGGYVYRGPSMPSLSGHYFYSDFCTGWIRSFRVADGQAVDHTEWDVPNPGRVTSFGEDDQGELYVLTSGGVVYRIDPT